jgi:hypothetical protein
MLLNSKNLSEIKYKTKRYKLEKAEAEINVALIPVELMAEARKVGDKDKESTGMKILIAAVVDDNGKPVFESPEAFQSLPLAVQNEIADKVYEYNGLIDDRTLEKN